MEQDITSYFVIWHGGLEQMQGRNLISVVKELVG